MGKVKEETGKQIAKGEEQINDFTAVKICGNSSR